MMVYVSNKILFIQSYHLSSILNIVKFNLFLDLKTNFLYFKIDDNFFIFCFFKLFEFQMSFQNRNQTAVQSGRSFYTRPRQPENLSGFCEMWTGLFQSTMLGRIPYVNIDIAHKAFTQQTPVLKMLDELSQTIRWGPKFTPGQEVPRNFEEALGSALRGYNIAYQKDQQSPLITKMCMGISGPANRVRFEHQGNQITVDQYFKDMKSPLRYPMYPCIIGPNKSHFPIEHCTLIGGQVRFLLNCLKMCFNIIQNVL